MKKFKSIEELKKSIEFKNRDLSYCDLSDLDLSTLPSETWDFFKFFHTDFSNTNIVFRVYYLKPDDEQLTYCNFTNCDLSYINNFGSRSLEGCNFKNTHLFVPLPKSPIKNVIFSEEMESKLNEGVNERDFDIAILRINPHVRFNSYFIFKLLKCTLPAVDAILTEDEINRYSAIIDEALEEDRKREGNLYKLYQNLSANFRDIDKVHFFSGYVSNQDYEKLDFSFVDYRILNEIEFNNCKINTVIAPETLTKYNFFVRFYDDRGDYSRIPYLIIPSLNEDAWQNNGTARVGASSFTYNVNLYLELGRACNAKCPFCRNQYLKPCKYDYERIKYNLKHIRNHFNNIVIGGGEPTLDCVRNDLINFGEYYRWEDFTMWFSTNGSLDVNLLSDLRRFRILLSRHCVNDQENDNFFGVKTLSTPDINRLIRAFYDKVTLTATCNKKTLYTVSDIIDYIKFAQDCGARDILLQNLEEDLEGDITDQIGPNVFNEVISILAYQGFKVSDIPIYSTGNYKLTMLTSPNRLTNITIKEYLPSEIITKEWNRAAKRTFDLSMAPNGEIYSNWHQKNGLIKVKVPHVNIED